MNEPEACVPCKFGSKCYRRNPEHLKQFYHPGVSGHNASDGQLHGCESEKLNIQGAGQTRFTGSLHGNHLSGKNRMFQNTSSVISGKLSDGQIEQANALENEMASVNLENTNLQSEIVPRHFLKDSLTSQHGFGLDRNLNEGRISEGSSTKLMYTEWDRHLGKLPVGAFQNERKPRNAPEHSPLMVVLVGLPGAGKSTFCRKLVGAAHRTWTRVCQDVIANGKRGNRKQCLKLTESALSSGRSVLIDRCNMDVEQRKDFLATATRMHVDVHAILFNFPMSVCIARATARQAHEGGVEGQRAEGIVKMKQRQRQSPALDEGFKRITVCGSDTEVADTLELYKNLTVTGILPEGVFGALPFEKKSQPANNFKSSQAKRSPVIKLGMAASGFAKVHKGSRNESADQGCTRGDIFMGATERVVCAGDNAEPGENNRGNGGAGGNDDPHGNNHNVDGGEKDDRQGQAQEGVTDSFDDVATHDSLVSTRDREHSKDSGMALLAFPSLSTSDFKFDHDKAASVIVDTVQEFLGNPQHGGMGLVLLDLSENSSILKEVRKVACDKGLSTDSRFQIFVGDITKLRSSGGPPCHVIANAANWRLKEGGGGVNAAIHRAAGPSLIAATKKRADTLSVGSALAVPVPPTSPLHQREGVTHVIHVLGPNMNSQRPNCLRDDYTKGTALLREAYRSLFSAFMDITKDLGSGVDFEAVSGSGTAGTSGIPQTSDTPRHMGDEAGKAGGNVSHMKEKSQSNAFEVLMCAAKQKVSPVLLSGNSGKKKREGGQYSAKLVEKKEAGSRDALPASSVEVLRQDHANTISKEGAEVEEEGVGGSRDATGQFPETAAADVNSPICGSSLLGRDGGHNGTSGQGSSHEQVLSSSGGRQLLGSDGDRVVDLVALAPGGSQADHERVQHEKVVRGGKHGGGDHAGRVGEGSQRGGAWSDGLKLIARHPEKHQEAVLEYDDLAVVVKDLYPKARHHVLVVARKDGLDCISQAGKEHLPLLRHMETLGRKWAAELKESAPSRQFQLGYHAEPSMRQLHLHVISQDFDSPCLKNKKHWNSFTSQFFLPSSSVLEKIEQNGSVPAISPANAERLLKQELRCHICHSVLPNIPRLKLHIMKCNGS